MISSLNVFLIATLAGAVLVGEVAQASPYYFFSSGEPSLGAATGQEIKETAKEASGQVKQIASDAKQGVAQLASGGADAPKSDGQLPTRIQGHLSELYTHGSSAIHSVVDKVQPDIKNIGRDITDAYQATRSEVGKRIEPLAQTVRPYIDQYVSPYVNQAREEVPKLINQAKPTLSNLGEQVRGGITGVWSKIGGTHAGEAMEKAKAAGEDIKQQVGNNVQQKMPTSGSVGQ